MEDRRRTHRFKVGATTVATIDEVTYVVRIDDVSYGGVKLITDLRPEIGTRVSLATGSGEFIEGEVARHADDGFALDMNFTEQSASYALKTILGRVFDKPDDI